MANTRYLTTELEGHVRQVLSHRHGVLFEKRRLPLISGGLHEFDAVSSDGQIVAAIKSASGRTAGGNIPSGKIKDCVAELYFLSLLQAPRRMLILTTPEFHEIFMTMMARKIAPGINVVLERLPEHLQRQVAAVQARASAEMFPVLDADEQA